MIKFDPSGEEDKISSWAARHLRAINNQLNLSIMLILFVLKFYLLSILSCLIYMRRLHDNMYFMSFIWCWKYALIIIINALIMKFSIFNIFQRKFSMKIQTRYQLPHHSTKTFRVSNVVPEIIIWNYIFFVGIASQS